MKSLLMIAALASALQLASFSGTCAEAAKTYQVTGPVLELTDKAIVVQKGDDRWEVARDEKTRVDGALKVGEKVTIHYRMVAVSVDSKDGKSEGKKKAAK
jgi:hypothetical protein